ncbi:MAG: Dickkopf N-terminal cysteine-rich domain-containing protein [Myxococcales bacterium]
MAIHRLVAFLGALALAGCPSSPPPTPDTGTPPASKDGGGGPNDGGRVGDGGSQTADACVPKTCEDEGRVCGTLDDGCGGEPLDCGSCKTNQTCSDEGQCVARQCSPACSGTKPVCDPVTVTCKCTATSCPAGQFCQKAGTCGPCRDTGSVTIDSFCTVIDDRLVDWTAWQYQACGNKIDDASATALHTTDVEQLDVDLFERAAQGTAGVNEGLVVAGVFPSGVWSARTTCAQDLDKSYAALKASVKAGRVCFNSKSVDECMAAAAVAQPGSAPPEVCSNFFSAKQTEGLACSNQWECVAGLYCKAADTGLASCDGVCSKPLAADAPCTSRDVCVADTSCRADSNKVLRCQPLAATGEPCSIVSCAAGLYCASVTTDGGIKQTCAPLLTQGRTCTADSQCVKGLRCLPTSGTNRFCALAPLPGQVGDTCMGTTGVECAACLWCEKGTSSVAGTCKQIPGPGEPCLADGCPSHHSLECVRGVCKAMPRRGEACTVDSSSDLKVSQRGNCLYVHDYCKRPDTGTTGVCTENPKVGEPCANAYNAWPYCPAGAYCKAGTCAPAEADGAVCDPNLNTSAAACQSGSCIQDSTGTLFHCGQLPGPGQPCARTSTSGSSYSRCAEAAWCDTNAKPATCMAKKAGGAVCASPVECESNQCESQVCTLPCLTAPGADTTGCGSYTGFNWFAKLIFAAGTLVFLGKRRRFRRD